MTARTVRSARRSGFLLTTLALGSALALYACGAKKPPPKAPQVTEVVADAGEEDAAPPAPKTLHERLGGQSGLAKVVDTLMKNAAAHDKLKKRFGKVPADKLEKYKAALATQLCDASEGHCSEPKAEGGLDGADAGKPAVAAADAGKAAAVATGAKGAEPAKASPKDAYKGLKMTEAEWDPFVASFKASLDENAVGETEQADLIALLAPLKDDLVEKKK